MHSNGIVINWDYADEFIEVDFDNLDKLNSIQRTKEWWHEAQRFVDYNVISEITKNEDDSITVKLSYLLENNQDIDEDEALWGTSKFTLKKEALSGNAEWVDSNNPENDGLCPWYRIDRPLTHNKEKTSYEKKKRQQTQLRQLLLATDRKCVITGEKTKECLEAAHIIPASENGIEWPNNGVLLRADIHRLYDSGKFDISKNGKIIKVKKGEISKYYFDILKNGQLPEQTFKRIKNALSQKNALTRKH